MPEHDVSSDVTHDFDELLAPLERDIASRTHPVGAERAVARGRRRRQNQRLAVAAAVVALTAGWFARGAIADHDAPPANHKHADPDRYVTCHTAGITCLGGQSFLFDLADPVRWNFHDDYDTDVVTATAVDILRQDDDRLGVSVWEKVRPAGPLGRALDPSEPPLSPRELAEWLASRPFLDASTPTRTRMAGHVGWEVRVQVAEDASRGTATCGGPGGPACHPLLVSDAAVTTASGSGGMDGIYGRVIADYTFVSLPSGTAAVSWWTIGNDPAAAAAHRTAAEGITFPGH